MTNHQGHDPWEWCLICRDYPQSEDPGVNAAADAIMAEVEKDMTEGFSWGVKMPRDVGSFSAMHDWCDANEYLIDAIPSVEVVPCNCGRGQDDAVCSCPPDFVAPDVYNTHDFKVCNIFHAEDCAVHSEFNDKVNDIWVEFGNAVSDEVDRRLRVMADEVSGPDRCTRRAEFIVYGNTNAEFLEDWTETYQCGQHAADQFTPITDHKVRRCEHGKKESSA